MNRGSSHLQFDELVLDVEHRQLRRAVRGDVVVSDDSLPGFGLMAEIEHAIVHALRH